MTKTIHANYKTGLRVLMTNSIMANWSGSELYIRDVAIELIKRGHVPGIYSPRLGKLAKEIRAKSISVVNDLNSIGAAPDLIHGQHHLETMTALLYFPDVPAVFFCHGWLPWKEIPPIHPRIVQYVTVSDTVRDWLISEHGIQKEKITTILNFVDLARFRPRSALPPSPKRGLVFSNQASESNYVGIVREACNRSGISVDVIGYANGNPSFHPEALLGNYDIIFARGRAALEGLAVGAAVICCDLEGAGPMVTTKNLEWLRRKNLGIKILDRLITVDNLSREIQQYNAADAQEVSQTIRATAGLTEAVDDIFVVYNSIMTRWAEKDHNISTEESRAVSTYLKWISEEIDEFNELSNIKDSLAWRLYQRMKTSLTPLRDLYLLLINPFRLWRFSRRAKANIVGHQKEN